MIIVKNRDCLRGLRSVPDCSVDSCVTDPPYGINFMAKGWDSPNNLAFHSDVWKEILRVLKPGGYVLAFGGTRMWHRLAIAIEDAGFEIRDTVAWVYGSGFPKSLNISKGIDKLAGAERKVIATVRSKGGGTEHINRKNNKDHNYRPGAYQKGENVLDITAPATNDALKWDGWGTALKPAFEPIIMARKPLEGTVVKNVLRHGTGGINIDKSRVGTSKNVPGSPSRKVAGTSLSGSVDGSLRKAKGDESGFNPNVGRWPANFVHDGSEEVEKLFPSSKSCNTPSKAKPEGKIFKGSRSQGAIYPGEDGSAARFFYCAKPSGAERKSGNGHPTMKPVALMKHLVKLVTPPGGIVLDPFSGTGTTGVAAVSENFSFLGFEKERAYFNTTTNRVYEALRNK